MEGTLRGRKVEIEALNLLERSTPSLGRKRKRRRTGADVGIISGESKKDRDEKGDNESHVVTGGNRDGSVTKKEQVATGGNRDGSETNKEESIVDLT